MPSRVKSARIALLVLAGFGIPAGVLLLAGAAVGIEDLSYLTGALLLMQGAVALLLAARFQTRGMAVRNGVVVFGSVIVVEDVVSFATGKGLPIVAIVFGLPILIGSVPKEAVAWFTRPKRAQDVGSGEVLPS